MMSVSEVKGIGAGLCQPDALRQAGQVPGTTTAKTDFSRRLQENERIMEKSFTAQAAEWTRTEGNSSEAVLHGADKESDDIAVSAWADVAGGLSISVYRPRGFDLENPVYKVKIWDRAGNVTEQMVDAANVNPEDCDTAEMYAYTSYLKESGKGSFEETVLKAVVAKAVKNAGQKDTGPWSFSQKTDWIKIVNDIMQSEYRFGDLKGYMEWKKFSGFLKP